MTIILAIYLSKSKTILFKTVCFYRWWFYKHYLRRQILYTSSKTDGRDRWILISMHLFWNKMHCNFSTKAGATRSLLQTQLYFSTSDSSLALSLNLIISFIALFPVMSKTCINAVVQLCILYLPDEQYLPTSEYVGKIFFLLLNPQ